MLLFSVICCVITAISSKTEFNTKTASNAINIQLVLSSVWLVALAVIVHCPGRGIPTMGNAVICCHQ